MMCIYSCQKYKICYDKNVRHNCVISMKGYSEFEFNFIIDKYFFTFGKKEMEKDATVYSKSIEIKVQFNAKIINKCSVFVKSLQFGADELCFNRDIFIYFC